MAKALSSEERSWVVDYLKSRNDFTDDVFMGWIEKDKRGKTEDRLLIISRNRITSAAGVEDIRRTGHVIRLKSVTVSDLQTELHFREFELVFSANSDVTRDIVTRLWKFHSALTVGWPAESKAQFTGVIDKNQFNNTTLAKTHPVTEVNEFSAFRTAFDSYCNYHEIQPTRHFQASLQTQWHPLSKLVSVESICSYQHFSSSVEAFTNSSNTHTKILDLNMLGRSMKEQTAAAIAFTCLALRYRHHYQEVSYYKGPLKERSLDAIAEYLHKNHSVRVLRLKSIGSPANLGGLPARICKDRLAISPKTNVQCIDLSDNPMPDESMLELADGLRDFSGKLLYLNVAGWKCQPKATIELLTALSDNDLIEKNLFVLDISDNLLGQSGTMFLYKWLRNSGQLKLKQFSAENTDLKPAELVLNGIIIGKRPIQALNISRNPIDDECALILSQLLARTKFLSCVDISDTGIRPLYLQACVASLAANTNLQSTYLNASQNDVGPEHSIEIASIIKTSTNIGALLLNDCSMGAEGMEYMCKALIGKETLQILSLDRNVRDKESSTKIAEALADVVCTCPKLVSLSIQGGKSYKINMSLMLSRLAKVGTIRDLNVSGNRLNDKESVQALESLIKENRSLTRLMIDDNHFDKFQFRNLSDAMEENTALVTQFPGSDFEALEKKEGLNATKVIQENWRKALERNRVTAELAVPQPKEEPVNEP